MDADLLEFVARRHKDKPKAVIFDVDGTLSSTEWRAHMVARAGSRSGRVEPENWPLFHGSMVLDAPIEDTIDLLHGYQERGYKIVLLTLRPERFREATEKWMADQGVPFDELFMRPPNDHTPGVEKKRQILNDEIRPKYDVQFAYDDWPANVDMFEEEGIGAIQVHDPKLPPLPGEPIEDPKYASSRMRTIEEIFGIPNRRPNWMEYKHAETKVWIPPHTSVTKEGKPYPVKGHWRVFALSAVERLRNKLT